MNDQAANKMLKTLEEPPPFAHLVLLTDKPGNMLADDPLALPARALRGGDARGAVARGCRPSTASPPLTADACARLALGDAERALALALAEGPALRDAAERFARAALHATLADAPARRAARPRARPRRRGRDGRRRADRRRRRAAARPRGQARSSARARRRGKRAHRRAHAATIDHGLQLVGLWLRDVAVVKDGAPELVHHVDRAEQVRADAEATRRLGTACATRSAWSRRRARCRSSTRREELALEALASKLERTLVA